MRIIPPGSGIIHQVNLEYLARVVFDQDGYYYPDSLVGTDSHTTMIDGLGVLGWGECPPCVLCCSCALAYVGAIAPGSMGLCDHRIGEAFVPALLAAVFPVPRKMPPAFVWTREPE